MAHLEERWTWKTSDAPLPTPSLAPRTRAGVAFVAIFFNSGLQLWGILKYLQPSGGFWGSCSISQPHTNKHKLFATHTKEATGEAAPTWRIVRESTGRYGLEEVVV